MRVIIYGAGAVGSVIGGRLAQANADVVLIARTPHVDAIRESGLLLRTGTGEERVDVAAVGSLSELQPGPDDVVTVSAALAITMSLVSAAGLWPAVRPLSSSTHTW